MEGAGQEQTLSSEGTKRKIVEDFELARHKVLEVAARLNNAAEHKRPRFDSPDVTYANSVVSQPSYPEGKRESKPVLLLWVQPFFLVLFVWGPGVLGFQMRCFSCLQLHRKRNTYEDALLMQHPDSPSGSHSSGNWKRKSNSYSCGLDMMSGKTGDNDARSFTFLELATATKNFREANLIGEGGFGKVYRGRFDNGQEIAAKTLNSDGHQGNQEFIVEVLMLSLLHHPNLVKLIGYCAEGDHMLLVYEYMPMGSLSDHLYENDIGPILEWNTRMNIVVGAAKGIEYWWTSKGAGCGDLWSRGIWKNNSFSSCDC